MNVHRVELATADGRDCSDVVAEWVEQCTVA